MVAFGWAAWLLDAFHSLKPEVGDRHAHPGKLEFPA
jgi:hypothetical protein